MGPVQSPWPQVLLELLIIVTGLFNWITQADCQYAQCYWNIFDKDDKRGVQIIDVKCTEGRVHWLDLQGAVRMKFHLPNVSAKIKACFKMRVNSGRVIVSRETKNDKLLPLTILDAVSNEQVTVETCLNVDSEGIVLFAESNTNSGVGSLIIDYDMTIVGAGDDMEECRPCTEEEILLSFCTSDFVFRGQMESVKHVPEISHTEVNVKVDKLYRQPFVKKPFKTTSKSPKMYSGSLYVPMKCQVMYGEGDFLFTGKMRLGRPILQCAPQWEQWIKLRSYSMKYGGYICSLQ